MKQLICFLFTVLCCFNVCAQNKPMTIKWSQEDEVPRTYTPATINEYLSSGQFFTYGEAVEMIGMGTPRLRTYLCLYDKNYKMTTKLKLEDALKSRPELVHKSTAHLKDKMCLFQVSEKNNQTEMWALPVNKTTLSINEKEVKKIVSFPAQVNALRTITSLDSSKVLASAYIPTKANEKIKLSFSVSDNNLTELWKKNATLPYSSDKFIITFRTVDNSGAVIVFGLNERGKTKQAPQYKILRYTKDVDQAKELNFKMKDPSVEPGQYYFMPKENGNYAFFGLLKNVNTKECIGFFSMLIDGQTGAVVAETQEKFSKKLLSEDSGDKTVEKLEKKFSKGNFHIEEDEIQLSNYKLLPNGKSIFFSEVVEFADGVSTGGMVNSRTSDEYYGYDLLVTCLSATGTIEWTTKITKKQRAFKTGILLSYGVLAQGNNVHIIFNDNPKNMSLTKGQEPSWYNGKEGVLVMVSLDDTGKKNKRLVYDHETTGFMAIPASSILIGANEFIFIAREVKIRPSYQTQKVGRVKF